LRLTARQSWLIVAAVLIVVAAAVTWVLHEPSTSPAAARTPMPTGVAGDWMLAFDDEFNGTGLDTAKWSTGWGGGTGITPPVNSSEDDCYDPAQVTEGGGALSLSLIRKSESCGISAQYAAGLISTNGKFNFTYGFIQARIWVPGAPGDPDYVANWPGVWTDGQNWPEDGEIDIAEGIGGHMCAHFHDAAHSSQGLGAGDGTGCPSGVYTGGWHTFAANWEPGIITYYYDGHDIGSVTSGVTSAPMYLILDYDAQSPVQAPDTMKVDYIRVWQHS
jgi:beta-glucanase (GH16 family)